MIDNQMGSCFNTRSPVLHLFYQSNAQYITSLRIKDVFKMKTSLIGLVNTFYGHFI